LKMCIIVKLLNGFCHWYPYLADIFTVAKFPFLTRLAHFHTKQKQHISEINFVELTCENYSTA